MLSLVGLFVGGCGPFGPPPPTFCDAPQRSELLKAKLDPYTPSAQFTMKSGTTGWIQLWLLPQADEEPFVRLAGAGEVYSVHSGTPPNITTTANGDMEPNDPSFTIKNDGDWEHLPLAPGDWQLYSFSDPGIEVVSCPA